MAHYYEQKVSYFRTKRNSEILMNPNTLLVLLVIYRKAILYKTNNTIAIYWN